VRAWSQSDWRVVFEVLGRHHKGEIRTKVLDEISSLLGERCSEDTLRHRLEAGGHGTPSRWCVDNTGPVTDRAPGSGVEPSKVERVAIIPDTHVPDQDPVAWPTALAAIEAFKPDTIVLLGDFGDFNSISSHGRRPDKIEHLKSEIEAVNRELDKVQAIGAKRVIFCEGNHEYRAARFVQDHAPALYGMFTMKQLLRIKERGWEWVPYRSFGKIGKLHVTHDCGHAGITSAARSRDSFGSNVVVGHSHCSAITYKGDALGETHVGASCGWLGDPKAVSYTHRVYTARNWQHSFAVAYVERQTGNAHVHLIPVIGGRCCVEGRIVEAA
jgi:hypothetical protein